MMLKPLTFEDHSSIRKILKDDLGKNWSETSLSDLLKQSHYYGLGYYQQGVLKAFSVMTIIDDEAEIVAFGVMPDFRRQGLGQILWESLAVFLKEKNVNCVFLDVSVSNYAAVAFYKKMSFIELSTRKDYYIDCHTGKKSDALLMKIKI